MWGWRADWIQPGWGTTDGIFLCQEKLQKRIDHCQDTWAVFIDLVKAFPSVSRNDLTIFLAKFGIPSKLVNIVDSLHTDVKALFKMGEAEVEIPNTSGTKQGDPLAAVLFLYIIQACLETLDQQLQKLEYCDGGGRRGGQERPELRRSQLAQEEGLSLVHALVLALRRRRRQPL